MILHDSPSLAVNTLAHASRKDLIDYLSGNVVIQVPVSIFAHNTSSLAALSWFLHTRHHLRVSEIARLLSKHTSAISTALKRGKAIAVEKSPTIPLSSFVEGGQAGLSISEITVLVLKQRGLTLSAIGKLLGKHVKTIWTFASRAEKKLQGASLGGATQKGEELAKLVTKDIRTLRTEVVRRERTLLPLGIFSQRAFSPLEALVVFLKDERGMKNADIARLLGKHPPAISVAYRNAQTTPWDASLSGTNSLAIPLEELALYPQLSLLERVVYLAHTHHVRSHQLAEALGRDARTISTVLHRAQTKLKGGYHE